MKNHRECRASLSFEGVERTEMNGPPSAFRIWKAGDNTTDHGPTFFTDRSAKLLLEQQERRGNRFSIDVNHLSLDASAPLENQRAVGWFDVDVRDGELWAVNVEWTDTVCAGLAKDPPEWRYHSPAYDIDVNTGEVLSLTNLALTNNPATWRVTALASCGASQRSGSRMKLEDIKAAFEGADDEKKAAAWAAIARAMASTAGEGDEPDGDEKKDTKAEGDEPEKKDTKASGDEPEKKDEANEPEKKDTKATSDVASILAAQDARLRKLESENAALRKKDEDGERRKLIATREMSDELAKTLSSKPLAFVKDVCGALPVKAMKVTSTESVQGTRGATQGTGEASALPADQKSKLDERMGLKRVHATIKREGNKQIFPAMTPEEAKAFLASKGGK